MTRRSILYEQIYTYLKQEIQSGNYKTGDLLPTEQELTTQFGVSRMTTNRALQLLNSEGLIVRKAGIGTFVAEQPVSNRMRDTQAVYELTTFGPNAKVTPMYRNIGFVIPFLTHSFGPELLAEIERELHEQGITLSVACSYGSQATEEEVVERLIATGTQGLIVCPVNGEFYNPAILRLHVNNFPIVLVDKQLPGIPVPFVTSDNTTAARDLTEHLLGLGHRSIVFFSPEWKGTSTLSERRDSFVATLTEHGIEHQETYDLRTIPWTKMEDGLDVAQLSTIMQFLNEHPEVTAVFATDDQLAEYWLEAARRCGKRVPDELSIVCFDGPSPKPAHWSYSCVLQNQAIMAREAVALVCELMNAGPSANVRSAITVPTRLRIGNSTAPAITCKFENNRLVAATKE